MYNKQYKIVGAFDTETTNIKSGITYKAFPILYQVGILKKPIEKITPDNAELSIDISIFREHEKCYDFFDNIIAEYSEIVPVILVHNLGFDIYSLAPWLLDKEVRVLAKTARKPIAITILDEAQNPRLVFLDTLGLFMKSLSRMGEECGMPKAIGDWDYSLIRTNETELTDEELYYSKQDIRTLLCYMAYFLRMNPDIKSEEIGSKIFTKTGIVRAKRLYHLGKLKNKAGQNVKRLWDTHNHLKPPRVQACIVNNSSSVFGCCR